MYFLGLISGTSADGVDAALVDIRGKERRISAKLLGFISDPYPPRIRRRVLEISAPEGGSTASVAQLNVELGERFARAALKVCKKASLDVEKVTVIGSHGQTVAHLPEKHATLQLGEPAVIAAVTGRPVVADFRPADIAAGGQGAPLTPLADFLLLRHKILNRAILNIGGISNITFLPAGIDDPNDLIAFDTGPGNMIMDSLTAVLTGGKVDFDRGGAMARSGKVRSSWQGKLLKHPYFRKSPPKSAGREQFGAHYLKELLLKFDIKTEEEMKDLLATLVMSVARSVAVAIGEHILPKHDVDELLACGGGAHNGFLMECLKRELAPIRVATTDSANVPIDAREAMAFAILARETWEGRPGNVPAATGAKRAVTLGKIICP